MTHDGAKAMAGEIREIAKDYTARPPERLVKVQRCRKKPVIGIWADGEEEYFDSITDCAEKCGCSGNHIWQCLNGKRRMPENVTWRYATEAEIAARKQLNGNKN